MGIRDVEVSGRLSRIHMIALAVLTVGVGLLLLATAKPAHAAAGGLDGSFNGDGKLIGPSSAEDVVIQPNGKIVAGHSVDFSVVRYNANGRLDTTFGGGDGKASVEIGPSLLAFSNAIALQKDGKIVVAGGAESEDLTEELYVVVRYNANGSVDTTFGGGDGIVMTDFGYSDFYGADEVLIQPDAKIIVVGGWYDLKMARYNPDGSLDPTFGNGGKLRVQRAFYHVDSAALQKDGKIVVAGDHWGRFGLNRYKPNGRLDTSFGGGDGKVRTDFNTEGSPDYFVSIGGLAIQPDGKIIAAGHSGEMGALFTLARYYPGGALDKTFGGGDGSIRHPVHPSGARLSVAQDVALQADGKIVAVGYTGPSWGDPMNFAVVRYTENGGLDRNFGGDSMVETDFSSRDDGAHGVAIQEDGKIVVAGSTGVKLALARYHAN